MAYLALECTNIKRSLPFHIHPGIYATDIERFRQMLRGDQYPGIDKLLNIPMMLLHIFIPHACAYTVNFSSDYVNK